MCLCWEQGELVWWSVLSRTVSLSVKWKRWTRIVKCPLFPKLTKSCLHFLGSGALVSFLIVCMPLLIDTMVRTQSLWWRLPMGSRWSTVKTCSVLMHTMSFWESLIYTRKHWLHSRIFHKLHPLGIHDLVEELKSNDYNNKDIYEVQRRYGRRKIIYIWSRGGVKSGKVWRRKWFLSWAWHMDKILIEIFGEASVYSFAKWKW